MNNRSEVGKEKKLEWKDMLNNEEVSPVSPMSPTISIEDNREKLPKWGNSWGDTTRYGAKYTGQNNGESAAGQNRHTTHQKN